MNRVTLTVVAAALLALPAIAQQPQSQQAPAAAGAPASAQQRNDGAASDSHGFVSATRFGQRDGASLYAATCAGCHMPDGRGAAGAGRYPALAGNPTLEAAAYPASIVLNGLRGMPGFANQMDDAQVAAVVNYVRTNLGNRFTADPATPDDVKALRQ
ncbi:c-type cytochrome [Pararoseomonas indoligenes]|uniref:Cytochrome c n=1 Tax=Roseomonas indoligenes TaxID=2820811 RepID=A0A940MVJ6_9PROT|nr:cytochrome c [Pararoseomonas indoligenes]MBP0494973.1 cytochrome c [Pararoseomonas indoligenes]